VTTQPGQPPDICAFVLGKVAVCESGDVLSPDVVTAIRAIVADHEHVTRVWGDKPHQFDHGCLTCCEDKEYGLPQGMNWCPTMLALARIWRITEDYSPLWDEQHRVIAGSVEQPARELT
jgi:hypothetical protein